MNYLRVIAKFLEKLNHGGKMNNTMETDELNGTYHPEWGIIIREAIRIRPETSPTYRLDRQTRTLYIMPPLNDNLKDSKLVASL
jgi:hypothetical protein